MILAKPVIADRYWILKKDNHKVGEIEAVENGYTVKIQNTVKRYTTIKMLGREANIEFAPAEALKLILDEILSLKVNRTSVFDSKLNTFCSRYIPLGYLVILNGRC